MAQFNAADFAAFNEMQHVSIDIADYADAGSSHTLELVDTSAPVASLASRPRLDEPGSAAALVVGKIGNLSVITFLSNGK